MLAAAEAMALAKLIHPVLAGHDPDVQGAALCDLLGTWLAGHPRPTRLPMLVMHIVQTPT